MKIVLPAYDEPVVLQNGVVNPTWYSFFSAIVKRLEVGTPTDGQFLVFADGKWILEPATAPTNGQVLVWNSTTKKWVPGAN